MSIILYNVYCYMILVFYLLIARCVPCRLWKLGGRLCSFVYNYAPAQRGVLLPLAQYVSMDH